LGESPEDVAKLSFTSQEYYANFSDLGTKTSSVLQQQGPSFDGTLVLKCTLSSITQRFDESLSSFVSSKTSTAMEGVVCEA
jgi:hypothetical protein